MGIRKKEKSTKETFQRHLRQNCYHSSSDPGPDSCHVFRDLFPYGQLDLSVRSL